MIENFFMLNFYSLVNVDPKSDAFQQQQQKNLNGNANILTIPPGGLIGWSVKMGLEYFYFTFHILLLKKTLGTSLFDSIKLGKYL